MAEKISKTVNLLGIEIGGTKLQLVTGTVDGKIVDRQQVAVERSLGGDGIRARITMLIQRLQPDLQWGAIGVGYGGPVDWRTGHIRCSHHVEGWNDFPLGDWLRGLTGIPVVVDNDTNVAAYAEATCGAGTGANPVFYTNSGSGVGGGCVVDGHIYHGAPPGESEFGHLRLDRQGSIVENFCSGWALDRIVRDAVSAEPESVLSRCAAATSMTGARALVPALREACPLATRILAEAGENLAFALSHVIHLFHPQVIVLGGGVALIGEPWRVAVSRALSRYVMEAFRPEPEVRLAALGEFVVPRGALLLAEKICEGVQSEGLARRTK